MKRFKTLILVLVSMLMLSTCAAPAYALVDEDEETPPVETPAQPLTPEGNMNLVDDIEGEAAEDKQFIAVQSRGGHYFYIIIDHAAEGETRCISSIRWTRPTSSPSLRGEERAPAVCSCTEKCAPGAVNTACEICAVNMGECAGKKPEPVEPDTPEEPETPEKPEKKGNSGPLLIVLVLAAAGVGAIWAKKAV